jgi:glycosyltransferase involved in cell wall biosynthesis
MTLIGLQSRLSLRVLIKGNPNLEYFVMDGGSTDESIEIIRKYAPWINHWESEADKGQADAINKALERATGEWFQNVNSDDSLYPGALFRVSNTPSNYMAYAAPVVNTNGVRDWVTQNSDLNARNLILARRPASFSWHQPGVVFRTFALKGLGGYPLDYFLFDLILTTQYLEIYSNPFYDPEPITRFRVHPTSQTSLVKLRGDRHDVLARKFLAKKLLSRELFTLARREAVRLELEGLLLDEDGRHYYQWTRLFSVFKILIRQPSLLFDRVLLAAIYGLSRGRRRKSST